MTKNVLYQNSYTTLNKLKRKLKLFHKKIIFVTLLTAGLQCSSVSAQSYQWGNVAIGGGGFVSAIITSKTEKDVMYARTDVGGAYRWDAPSDRWIPLLDWSGENETGYLGTESLAIDPQDNNKIYILAGIDYFNGGKTAIFRSTDRGNNFAVTDVTGQFKAHGNGMGRQTGEKLVVDPNNGSTLLCGSRRNGLWRSTNSGASWSNLSSFPVTGTPNGNGVSLVVIDPTSGSKGNNSQSIFVGVSRTGTNFYHSTNGGGSFSAVSGGPTNLMPARAVLASDGSMYITFSNGAGPSGNGGNEPMDSGQIWKYNTKTGNWSNISPNFNRALCGISVDPKNPQRIIASSINNYNFQYGSSHGTAFGDRFFLSTNGGSSWRDLVGNGIIMNPNGCSWIEGHAIHWAGSIEFNPFNTDQAWVTSGNGVFTCDNVNANQTTWKMNVKGLEETVPLDIISIPNGPLLTVIGDYDGFLHNDIFKYAPIHEPRMGTSSGLAYGGVNTKKVLRVGNDMYYSNNTGSSWTKCSNRGSKGKVAISADGNTFLHCPENSNTTYRSTNNGASWSNCSGLGVGSAEPVADPVNSEKFYAYNPGGSMLISTDGGASFHSASSLDGGGAKLIRTVPGKEGHLWVALQGNGLKRSTNSGSSFTKANEVTRASCVGIGKAAPGSSYPSIYIWGTVRGVTGIFRSNDEGNSWTRVNEDKYEFGGPGNGQFVMGDMNVYGRVYMSTAGRGVAYGQPGGISAVEDAEITESFSNVKYYPNPFSNQLNIESKGTFTYTIYDMQGKLLEKGKGDNSILAGNSLAQGIYVVKIENSNGSSFFKINKTTEL